MARGCNRIAGPIVVAARGGAWVLAALAGLLAAGCPKEPGGSQDVGSEDGDGGCPAACPTGEVCYEDECCAPRTCEMVGEQCGAIDDLCGGTIDCGCTVPETCGGGGTVGVCGCTPTTCLAAGAECGDVLDGCGGEIGCGSCPAERPNCWTDNRCRETVCTDSCASLGYECDRASICGSIEECGFCGTGMVCRDNRCEPCSGPECPHPPTCTPDTYLLDCPDGPCEVATGCAAGGTCEYGPWDCGGTSGACPVRECQANRTPDGTGWINTCEVTDGARCCDDGGTVAACCPGVHCGACVGTRCVVEAARLTGTFVVGGTDQTIGSVTLRGNVGFMRPEMGKRCVSTVCVTGGIVP